LEHSVNANKPQDVENESTHGSHYVQKTRPAYEHYSNWPQGHPGYDYSDEIDLRQYIEILWKWKWAVFAVTAIAVATAGIMSFFVLKPVYEAVTQILVPKSILPNDVITSPYFLQTVLSKLNLGAEYTPSTLSKAISIQSAKVPDLTIIKVQDEDPATAQEIVNAIGDSFVEFVKKHNAEVTVGIVGELQAKKADSEKALEAVKAERDRLISEGDLSKLRLEVSRLGALISDRKTALLSGEAREKELEKGIEELQKSLESTPRTVPGPLDYAGRPTEVPNETYQQFEQSLAFKKVALAELQVQLNSIRTSLPSLEAQYAANQKSLLELEARISDLDEQISRLNTEIAAFNAEIVKTSTSLPEASVVAPAITPETPVKGRLSRSPWNFAGDGSPSSFQSLTISFLSR